MVEAALEHYPAIRYLVVSCSPPGRMAQDLAGHPNVFGGKRIAISANRNAAVERLPDNFINLGLLRYLADEYRPPVDVIFGQLSGLFFIGFQAMP